MIIITSTVQILPEQFGEPSSRELVEEYRVWRSGSLELALRHVESSHQLSL